MSDNKDQTGKPDRDRVNTSESYEVAYWCKKLGCSEAKLKEAVKAVGPMAKDVEEYLRRK